MKKSILFCLVVSLSLLTACSLFSSTDEGGENMSGTVSGNGSEAEILEKAQALYNSVKVEGVDFSNGPCLGIVHPDWVVDIAHSPRLPIDNRPENQCAEFRSGQVSHFVELDEEGNLIKMR